MNKDSFQIHISHSCYRDGCVHEDPKDTDITDDSIRNYDELPRRVWEALGKIYGVV